MGPMEILLILLPFGLILFGFGAGKFVERRHFASIIRREQATAGIVMTDLKRPVVEAAAHHAELVIGQAVIGSDYFKTIAANLRSLVGGEMRSLETLLERARREAILRMKDEAVKLGASEICNVRIETSNVLSMNRKKSGGTAAEVIAYGTAIVRLQ